MNEVIQKYYEENGIPKILLNQKLSKFEQNADIAAEFQRWIENGTYENDSAVTVEGFNAKSLSEKSQYLNGEGAFMMLIELRENPEKALQQIKRGFKRK